ncbi:MAG: copper chaperone PCu(A)C [Phenylobacterium sp.]|uniref:copper chaperone PCu(A)C n=1 Tax=Phenylobacterium sp. TaxID=1871053 RepID=UPI001A54AD0F|nr:copper chaperone PCu(A)C [Phenylobacterium sp.]MBL8772549.1 copper chaperone PCu(A)C [Phenylobacterium sp.]
MRHSLIFPAVVAVAAASIPAAAATPPQVTGAWSRPAAQGATGVGYMVLKNPGRAADALVSVETPAARTAMIHRSSITNGVASMQMVSRVPLAGGGSVTFAPGGYHLMFVGLARPLGPGDSLPATLVFASGARVKAAFVVGLGPPVATPHQH